MLKPDDIVWINDYHLMPLAKFLSERGHANKIGFFHHIPFPSLETVQALPHHREVTAALVHYDLVGLQTDNERHNFGRYLESVGGKTGSDHNVVEIKGRSVMLGAFPVGIVTQEFAR